MHSMQEKSQRLKVTPPNFTQTPNDLFDHWIPNLSESELKVLLIIMRKTFGWHRTHQSLSISIFSQLTGLSRQSVISATASLRDKGLILKETVGSDGLQETYYSLYVHETEQEIKISSTGLNNRPPPVQSLDPPQSKIKTPPIYMSKESSKEKEKETTTTPPKTPQNEAPQIGGGGSPKVFSEVQYKGPKGILKTVRINDIYRHFVRREIPCPEGLIEEAIQEIKSQDTYISDIYKYLESMCERILNDRKSKTCKKHEQSITCTYEFQKPMSEEEARKLANAPSEAEILQMMKQAGLL